MASHQTSLLGGAHGQESVAADFVSGGAAQDAARAEADRAMARVLLDAMARDELVLATQPIRNRAGDTLYEECLLRFARQDAADTVARSPAAGIAALERLGQVRRLDQFVLLRAIALLAEEVDVDHRMMGADVVIRHSDTTYLEGEIAQTEGRGAGRSFSNDGGFWLRPDTVDEKKVKGSGRAYSLKGQVDLADVSKGQLTGTVGGFYERMENGFSSLDHDIDATQRVVGGFANLKLNEQWTLTGDYEDYADADGEKKREGSADLEYQINEYWKVAFGARHVGILNIEGETKDNEDVNWNGDRTDLGARVTYAPNDDTSLYVFGQGTVAKSGNLERNDRVGIGAETKLTDRLGVGGEVSYGTSGWGALAALNYEPVEGRSYYAGYREVAREN